MDSVTSSFQKIAISQPAGAKKPDSDDETYVPDTDRESVANDSVSDNNEDVLADGATNYDSAFTKPTPEEQKTIRPFRKMDTVVNWDVYIDMIRTIRDTFIPRASRRDRRERQKSVNKKLENSFFIAGERPFQGNNPVNRIRLPDNYPEKLMYSIMLDDYHGKHRSDPLTKEYPVLEQELTESNYKDKFVRLIQLEEVNKQINLREYDMFNVVLTKKEGFFWLRVESLAEGRPSLLPGDVAATTLAAISGTINARGKIFEGVIHYVELEGIKLRFHPQFESQYQGEAVDVFFKTGRTSIRRQHFAVERASQALEGVLPGVYKEVMGNVLFPTSIIYKDPLDTATNLKWFNPYLNERQKTAVIGIVRAECRPSPYLVFGPPGTGKTVTVVEAILQIWKRSPNAKILACAGSNSCADTICFKLIESGAVTSSDVKRILAFFRAAYIPEGLEDYCTVGDDDEEGAWTSHRITISTCSNAGRLLNLKGQMFNRYTHVIIDEAATVTEPEALISVLQVAELSDGVIVLVGDPYQLGPVIHCDEAKQYGLEQTLMSRIFRLDPYFTNRKTLHEKYGGYNPKCVVKLIKSYRCCPELIAVNNKLFYNNELKCRLKRDYALIRRMEFHFPIVVIGVVGLDSQERDNPSWMNVTEILEVVKYYAKLTGQGMVSMDDIGIITPYRKQAERIRSFVRVGFEEEICQTSTVEDFQGQEKDVIIISLVRSLEVNLAHDKKYNLGFLFNEKRFNVATSRAKKMLIVIGNPFVMVMDPCWRELIKYAKDKGSYMGVEIDLGGKKPLDQPKESEPKEAK